MCRFLSQIQSNLLHFFSSTFQYANGKQIHGKAVMIRVLLKQTTKLHLKRTVHRICMATFARLQIEILHILFEKKFKSYFLFKLTRYQIVFISKFRECVCVNFRLHVNDKRYHVQPPPRSQLSLEEMGKLNDVRLLVAQVKYEKQTYKMRKNEHQEKELKFNTFHIL